MDQTFLNLLRGFDGCRTHRHRIFLVVLEAPIGVIQWGLVKILVELEAVHWSVNATIGDKGQRTAMVSLNPNHRGWSLTLRREFTHEVGWAF